MTIYAKMATEIRKTLELRPDIVKIQGELAAVKYEDEEREKPCVYGVCALGAVIFPTMGDRHYYTYDQVDFVVDRSLGSNQLEPVYRLNDDTDLTLAEIADQLDRMDENGRIWDDD